MRKSSKNIHLFIIICCIQFLFTNHLFAQNGSGPNDTLVVNGIVIENDTFPYQYLPDVQIYEKFKDPNRRNQLAKLRYNVFVVYPYAQSAAKIILEVEDQLKAAEKRKDKKRYLKSVEDELNEHFKEKLKSLTTTQGVILVKLINRQTGRDCYSILKQVKGGLNARIYQTAASFFDNNLKAQYDPFGKDKDIELIVNEIESQRYFQYNQYKLKTANQPSNKKK